MNFTKKLLVVLACIAFSTCFSQQKFSIHSPNGALEIRFTINNDGKPQYAAWLNSQPVLQPSNLGFVLEETGSAQPFPPLNAGFEVAATDSLVYNQSWQPVWGEVKTIQDNHHQLIVHLKHSTSGILLNVVFRVFNDGFGFRYEFPDQNKLKHFTVLDELTQFNLSVNHKAFWIPGDFDTNEYQPQITKLDEIEAYKVSAEFPEISTKSVINATAVQTPLMLKSDAGLYINIHEAALVNYPAMNLQISKENFCLNTTLVPDALGHKAYLICPSVTPWRTVVMSEKATDILASKIILNLNEPSSLKNTSWIKPMKFVGVWWEMHIGTGTWDYSASQDMNSWQNLANIKPHGKHSANTTNVKRYIDFASKHKFDAVLVEGWNTGWEDWFGKWKENVFDFVTPYPDFNVKELQRYAKAKNVKLMMHHETSGSVANYERQMDTAYRFMKQFGYNAVKTGYVGKIIPRGEHHDGQTMVNHYVHVAKKTAANQIMVDMHEPVRPTGLHRTYPNWLACEAARGMEFNAWSKGNNPNHETILPFTRLMGGPMDYTPGIFELEMKHWDKNKTQIIHTTLAKQLALYVTMYSPVQMAADLPQSYEKKLDAFQFIKDVAIDWDDSKYLEAEPGEYITVTRKAKNSSKWFLGAITNEKERQTTIALNFLETGKQYKATIYADAKDAHYINNPHAYIISTLIVNSKMELPLKLAAGGGCAVSFEIVK